MSRNRRPRWVVFCAILPSPICRSSRTPEPATCFGATAISWPICRVQISTPTRLPGSCAAKSGIAYSVLENEALWEREPALSRSYRLGVLLPGNGHGQPAALRRGAG